MCGICGIYNFETGAPVDKRLLGAMCRAMVHRGPDEEGVWAEGDVGLGHRRLNIIDLSTGQQPMRNEDGTIRVSFNGEIYNYRDLYIELKRNGHVFKTKSDTETIIHLYEDKGEAFLKDLRGMFAIALWDGRRKRLLLARDRLGKKPLYYFLDRDRIVFASELKAILSDTSVPRQIDPTALSDYLSFRYVPAPKSIFKGINKIEPGTYLVVGKDRYESVRYWNLPCKTDASFSLSSATDKLIAIFQDCVRGRLESEVPLGAFLSGGIDSSAVVSAMAGPLTVPVNTTSIGFKETGFNELPFSRLIAEKFNCNSHEYILEPDFVKHLPAIVYHLDEPFGDSSALPTYLLCQKTKENVTVALSGDGGDEDFAGYTRYRSAQIENYFRPLPMTLRKAALKPLLSVLSPRLRGYTFVENLTLSPERAMANTFFCYDETLKKGLFSKGFKKELSGYESLSLIEKYFSECASEDPVTRLQYVDLRTYLPEDILMKVDKMSMAHSLEVRAPFLDHRMVEFAFSLPSSFKLKSGSGKYILRRMLNGSLPREVLERKKAGFAVPVDSWFRGKLRGLVETVLFDKRTLERNHFEPAFIKSLWERYQARPFYQIDLSQHLWLLFVLELWCRIYIDGESPAEMSIPS